MITGTDFPGGQALYTPPSVLPSMEGESDWVVNGIITIALIALLIPLAAQFVEDLEVLLLVILIMYLIYTSLSGEAIDPPRPK